MKTTLALIIFIWCNFATFAQNPAKIDGQYNFGDGSILIINTNKTFMLVGYGDIIKGNVVKNGNDVILKPFNSEMPFALYGRVHKNKELGSKVMFQNFTDAQAVVNFDTLKNNPLEMKRVFNEDANCIPYPSVIENRYPIQKVYFAFEGQREIYEFENKLEYNDFVVFCFKPKNEEREIILKQKKNNLIHTETGKTITKYNKDRVSNEEIIEMNRIYDNAYNLPENYYCNPLYNSCEENIIDLKQYQKTTEGNEYYFIHKNDVNRDESDYQNKRIIYEYKKIQSKILVNQLFSINQTSSVFQYNCK